LNCRGSHVFYASESARDGGIIHQGMDGAKFPLSGLEQAKDMIFPRYVSVDRECPAAPGHNLACNPFPFHLASGEINSHCIAAHAGKLRNRGANAAAGASHDERALSVIGRVHGI
jgi:hypothetical protein